MKQIKMRSNRFQHRNYRASRGGKLPSSTGVTFNKTRLSSFKNRKDATLKENFNPLRISDSNSKGCSGGGTTASLRCSGVSLSSCVMPRSDIITSFGSFPLKTQHPRLWSLLWASPNLPWSSLGLHSHWECFRWAQEAGETLVRTGCLVDPSRPPSSSRHSDPGLESHGETSVSFQHSGRTHHTHQDKLLHIYPQKMLILQGLNGTPVLSSS